MNYTVPEGMSEKYLKSSSQDFIQNYEIELAEFSEYELMVADYDSINYYEVKKKFLFETIQYVSNRQHQNIELIQKSKFTEDRLTELTSYDRKISFLIHRIREIGYITSFDNGNFAHIPIEENTEPVDQSQNVGVWSITELQIVELGKAIYEHQKPKGISQKNFIENLGKIFNLKLTSKVQKNRLDNIKKRKGDQSKFLDELSGFLNTYLNN